jgi:transcriptional regulator with XRE-family HTH domain
MSNRGGPNPVDKHVGSRVRMRRLMLHVSQERLGDALEITFQQVQKYEKGTNRISASRLQQISDVLKVPIHFFFEGAPGSDASGSTPLPDYVTNFLTTPDGIALARAFSQISKSKLRHCIVDMVIDLAKRERD